MSEKLQAKILWQDGVPVAGRFDDPYYSLDDGLEESRFVFLHGANVPEHFSKPRTVIGETGFGTGLNFLATWQAWRDHGGHGELVFISTEAFPMSSHDMKKAHAHFPDVAPLADMLRAAMPPPEPGFHSCHFDQGRVRLLLLIGDATESLCELNAQVNAWYLDGFAPAKNPSMWTEQLFAEMARLSAPGATVATFTAAGFVRRGLIANGFAMEKTSGFGRKRERLIGKFVSEQTAPAQKLSDSQPLWTKSGFHQLPRSIAVLGAGIAGACLAYALKARGLNVKLIDAPGQHKASELPAAILAPRFLLSRSPEREFFAAAYAFAMQHPTFQVAFAETKGVLYPFVDDASKERLTNVAENYAWPKEWMQIHDQGLFLPKGGTVAPRTILQHLLEGAEIIEKPVHSIRFDQSKWQVLGSSDQNILQADCIVLAAGTATNQILDRSGLGIKDADTCYPEIRLVSGQIELFDARSLEGIDQHTISYGGYVSAALRDEEGSLFRTVGSTFDPQGTGNSSAPGTTASSTTKIMDAFHAATNYPPDDLRHSGSWAGLRGTVADHMPYAGPIPIWQDLIKACEPLAKDAKSSLRHTPKHYDGLYCLTGMGSKGFQYAPILAEYIAALIVGAPSPLPAKLVAKLHPARGMVRDIVRKKYELK